MIPMLNLPLILTNLYLVFFSFFSPFILTYIYLYMHPHEIFQGGLIS